jgi:hypothetical protein
VLSSNVIGSPCAYLDITVCDLDRSMRECDETPVELLCGNAIGASNIVHGRMNPHTGYNSSVTLIQTLLTPEGVIQVSDRLLTYPDGKVYETTANKAVMWCGFVTIGFTGMAFTRTNARKPIAEWICESLKQDAADGDSGIVQLQAAGAKLMRTTDYPDKRLTIAMAGATKHDDASQGGGNAYSFKVTNFEHVSPPLTYGDSSFHVLPVEGVPLGGNQYGYSTAGYPIPMETQQANCDELMRAHSRFGLNRAWRNMVGIQRRHSAEQVRSGKPRTIGMSAMVVYVPPMQVGQSAMMMTNFASPNLSSADTPQFSFIGESGFSRQRFGPHLVCGPMIVTGVVAESGQE